MVSVSDDLECCLAVSVPTQVIIITEDGGTPPEEATTTMTTTTTPVKEEAAPLPPPSVQEGSEAGRKEEAETTQQRCTIHLDPKEDRLFRMICETAQAFADGKIYIPSATTATTTTNHNTASSPAVSSGTSEEDGEQIMISLQIQTPQGQAYSMDAVKPTLRIGDLASRIQTFLETAQEEENVTTNDASSSPPHQHPPRLVYDGIPLSDPMKSLADYGILPTGAVGAAAATTLVIPPRRRPTIRVAGGWVRDKVLGLQTHDIDLAVDDCTGVQFARLLQQYSAKNTDKDENNTIIPTKIGVIACNPAQSKHLETATFTIHNNNKNTKTASMDVDISNLRAQEVYEHDSRIPTVRFGTPLEDAERRDFTMNALFFNLHTRQVEDWTRRGWTDLLIEKCLVTPLEPVQTLADDPLRVLRAIRFAVRYQFQLHPELERACQLTTIHQALHRKVSRERVGKELEGMLTSKSKLNNNSNNNNSSGDRVQLPILALQTIARLQLAGSVFALPVVGVDNVTAISGHLLGHVHEEVHPSDFNTEEARHLRQLAWQESEQLLLWIHPIYQAHCQQHASSMMMMTTTTTTTVSSSSLSQVDPRLFPMAVFLLPFRTLNYQEKKQQKWHVVVQYIIQHGIKFKNSDVKAMTTLQESVDEMVQLLRATAATAKTNTNNPEESSSSPSSTISIQLPRLSAGLLLRKTRELWPTCLLMAAVLLSREQQLHQQSSLGAAVATGDAVATTATGPVVDVVDWKELANAVYYHIVMELKLDECWKVKPLLDGKALIRALGNIPMGPLVGKYMEEQVRWMLLHPTGSQHECQVYLQQYHQNQQQQKQQPNQQPNQQQHKRRQLEEQQKPSPTQKQLPPGSNSASSISTTTTITQQEEKEAEESNSTTRQHHYSKKRHVEH